MKGLRLIARVRIQVVVASMNAALRNMPSGKKLQSRVAQAASASSVSMPAAPMARRCCCRRRRQAPEVSV